MEGGTGVYYQAMPAVGPDGKNVMKLIPVQKVNGRFYQTPFSIERDGMDAKPVHPPAAAASSQTQMQLPSVQSIADGRYFLKTLPLVGTGSDTVTTQNVGTNDLIFHNSKPVHVPLSAQSLSQYSVQLPPKPNRQGMAAVQTLPVTVKSPVLPNGHFLQIPPNAKVRTLPATALPQSIKCRIMDSVSNTPNLQNSPPTVVLVSPVNSVKLNSDQQVVSLTKPSQIQSLFQNVPPNLQTPGCIPKTNEEVNTPLKWVVQEGTGASAPCLVPVTTPNVDSDAKKAVEHVSSVEMANETVTSKATPPQTSQEKITQGKDNALVMCNGKVYFVAKKNSEIVKDVMISEGGKRGVVSTSPALPASSALGTNPSKQDPKRKVSEIIDLCDDGEETSTCLGGAPGNLPTPSQTEVDESDEDSNVIFVSYIPPKPKTRAGDKVDKAEEVQHTQTIAKSVSQNDGEKPAHAEIEKDSDLDNPSTKMSDEMKDKQVEANKRDESSLSCPSENVNVETEKKLEGGPSETRCQNDAAGDHTDRILKTAQKVCVQATSKTKKGYKKPDSDQRRQPKTDCQLRKDFGITSDVRICLQRSKLTVKPNQQTGRLIINKRTLDGLRKVIQKSKLQSKIQQMMQVPYTKKPEENEGLKAKRKKLDESQDHFSPSSTNLSPASKCSVVVIENFLACQEEVESTVDKVDKQSEKPADCTGNTSCFPSSEQKAKPTSSHTISPSSQRKTPARSKKGKVCTACPCGTVLGATEATSSLHSQYRPNLGTAVESHKGTRKSCLNKTPEECPHPQKRQQKNPDPVKKAWKKQSRNPLLEGSTSQTSNDISVNVTASAALDNPSASFSEKPQRPKRDAFPTQSLYTLETLDAEEIKRRERIERLKGLLKEKEAALERMQRSMNV
ncbi:ligand-dependent nuclear receptor-interacting factor 1 [Puntigrus tetrazona]|uniref:ligand-dependent nuclear receptor-interacting factor 1 n=1 Tax=Puntigrus tetrazona TaxID=1606681 RepID=UPI001C89F820|nr:ligand-dependent nuclear receptor-interacting factor 1 [Puntigrus tetrazona]